MDRILQDPTVRTLEERYGRERVLSLLREALSAARGRAAEGEEPDVPGLVERLAGRLAASSAPSLVPVVNATGVVVHTNLGRAPLSRAVLDRVVAVASSYVNLEYDVAKGGRGDREVHAEARLRRILGCEATAVVNNNAAAVLLAVNTLAEGREVLVSRGELVEIGGSFRIPDVLRKGGARLREVGTTNRTRIGDYRAALSPDTALVLKVHPSNFRIVGFTEAPTDAELVDFARAAGIPLVEDVGSGLLAAPTGPLSGERTVGDSLRAGVDLVTFSGDKLLGGPQAGLVAGRQALVAALRKNPLYRALRVDKMTLAAMDAVLDDHERGDASRVPVLAMLSARVEELEGRARAFAERLSAADLGFRAEVRAGSSAVGGGAAPTIEVPTALVVVDHASIGPDELASRLRHHRPPVIARVADGSLTLDLRTVAREEEDTVHAALARASLGS